MQLSTQLSRRALVAIAGATALVSVQAYAAQVITTSAADVEVREATPEFTRGIIGGSPIGELTVNNFSNGNRNLAIVRFHLPDSVLTGADLENYAELRLFLRTQGASPAGQNGSIRVYGLNPLSTRNSWNENNTFYRDAGTHQDVNGTGLVLNTPSVITQRTNPASVAAGVPAEPVSGVAGYGADPNNAQQAPGIRYENAPYSAQIEAENQARWTYNKNLRTTFENNGTGGALAYLTYINQPNYNIAKTATLSTTNVISQGGATVDLYNDVPESNRPFVSGATDTWVDDVTDCTLLGYSRIKLNSPLPSAPEGNFVSFGGASSSIMTAGLTPTELATVQADAATANANLVDFLKLGLLNNKRDFTFLIGNSIGNLDNALPNELQGNVSMNFASKEYTPANTAFGGTGAFAPQLVLAPEPGSLTLAGLAAVGLFGRRRRD